MKELIFIFLYPLLCIVDQIMITISINKFWKEWKQNSFEYKGYRFNKLFYNVVNDKLD